MAEETMRLLTHFEYSDKGADEQERLVRMVSNAVSPVGCEIVYAHASLYQKIFGGTLKGSDRQRRFIRITSRQSGRSVYRILRGVPTAVISSGILYIDSDGKSILSGDADGDRSAGVPLSFKKSNWFSFYWNTANTMVRITFRMGIVSLALGIVSLILGIISPALCAD